MGKCSILRVQDIADELNISYGHARRIRSEIRSEYNVYYVTIAHLEAFLGIDKLNG